MHPPIIVTIIILKAHRYASILISNSIQSGIEFDATWCNLTKTWCRLTKKLDTSWYDFDLCWHKTESERRSVSWRLLVMDASSGPHNSASDICLTLCDEWYICRQRLPVLIEQKFDMTLQSCFYQCQLENCSCNIACKPVRTMLTNRATRLVPSFPRFESLYQAWHASSLSS